MPAHQRPTMKDVADVAGVSIQTVSRVLNNSGAVSAATRTRVERAADDLKYRVNLAARSLASKQSQTVGMLVTGEIRFGVSEVFSALESRLTAEGKYLALATASTHDPAEFTRALAYLEGLQVGGLLVLAREEMALRLVASRVAIPCVVLIPGDHDDAAVSTVGIAQRQGAVDATRHLLDAGCRHIVHITGDLRWHDAQERLRGFRDTCEAAGVEPRWVVGDSWFADSGHAAATGLLADGHPLDAILGGNDDIALGALHALHEAGVDVPGQVQVVGYDDTPQAKYLVPALTTVRQPFGQLGATALAELESLIDGGPTRHIHLPAELIARGTTRHG